MKKTMVKSTDYELYKVPLPWKVLLRNNMNSLIVSELEKRHPRFSGNCCYDTRYLIERHNLIADVVVMDKASLAEYKNSGGELFLEEERKRNVFSPRTRIMRGLTAFLILLSGLLSLRIVISLLEDDPPLVELVSESASSFLEEAPSKTASAQELSSEVFASVSGGGGKISSFSFTSQNSAGGRSGSCKFSVYGCNSEEVANARYCVVSFRNNEPHFDLELPFTEKGLHFSSQRIPAEKDELALSSMRKSLLSIGAVIESEHDDEGFSEIIFHTPPAKLYSCLKTCAEKAESFGWCEKNLFVSAGDGIGKISVTFEKNHAGGEIGLLRLCAQYAYLFAPELKILPKKTRLFSWKNGEGMADSGKAGKDFEEKIGEIRRKDGSLFICVRKENGRIAYISKEAENAR